MPSKKMLTAYYLNKKSLAYPEYFGCLNDLLDFQALIFI